MDNAALRHSRNAAMGDAVRTRLFGETPKPAPTAHRWVRLRGGSFRYLVESNRDGEIIRSLAVVDDFGNLIIVF